MLKAYSPAAEKKNRREVAVGEAAEPKLFAGFDCSVRIVLDRGAGRKLQVRNAVNTEPAPASIPCHRPTAAVAGALARKERERTNKEQHFNRFHYFPFPMSSPSVAAI